MARKKSSPTYKTLLGFILSSRHVDSVESNVHTVKAGNSLFKVWNNDQLVPIGTEVAIDINSSTGKAYFA